jgi:hypothetical protein
MTVQDARSLPTYRTRVGVVVISIGGQHAVGA